MSKNFREIGEHFKDKLSKIKVCAFDADGILTNGLIHWDGEEVGFNRSFHVRDGYGMKILMEAGIKVGVVTGGNSLSITKRFKENLPVDFVFMGNENKLSAWDSILNMGFKDDEILYMGDEFFDIPLIKRAGFSATVPQASLEIQEEVDYITQTSSGMGCAREVIDILRYSRGIVPNIEH